uniref:Core shell protein Gag P30 domain-containing protein n=1 Tax=Gallus gallus TaxID=9031 RepID=A0A8V0YP80_CHICK
MGVLHDPFVLTLEKEWREKGENKVKHCCLSYSIGQQCIKTSKIRESEELLEHYQPPGETPTPPDGMQVPLRTQDGAQAPPEAQEPPEAQAPSEVQVSSGAQAPPDSPIASQTWSQQPLIIAPLREAVGPKGGPVLIKVPFSSFDLETWKSVSKDYWNDPLGVARHFQFLIRQHEPDWSDIQLLLDQVTETEKQLILKTAQTLDEDSIRGRNEDVKDHFPLQNPYWDPNTRAGRECLEMYREWVVKGMERAIPKTINWSNLFAVRQGLKESSSEFLDKLRDAMRKRTSLNPGSEEGIQQLVSLFIGQSVGDIRRKLQKLKAPAAQNLESLLEEAWRVFSNRHEVEKRREKKMLIAVLQETKRSEQNKAQKPLQKDQCAICRKRGHWKNECPLRKQKGKGGAWAKVQAPVEED